MDNNKEAVDVFNKYAEPYHDKFRNHSSYLATYEGFARLISAAGLDTGRTLDAACGSGIFSEFLLHRFPSLKITGIDLAPNMIRLARQNCPGAEFSVMDCREIGSLDTSFDIILLGFCLPYLSRSEAWSLLTDAGGIMTPGGLLYLSTMTGDYNSSGYQNPGDRDRIFTYYHEKKVLLEQLESSGFNVVNVETKPFTNGDGTQVDDLFVFARKSGA